MTLVGVALVNAATATVLGAVVTVATRIVRRPGVIHALWLLVLLDLLAPPMITLALLPRPAPATRAGEVSASGLPRALPSVDSRPASFRAVPGSAAVLTWLWLAGSASVAVLALGRALRFRRDLTGSCAPGPDLAARVAELARRAGLARAPRLRIVRATVPPLVWLRAGPPEIVLPAALLARLAPRERDALLVHEIAHVRRRDTLVRLVEVAATAAFWWHPLVFVARRALRRAEEQSCDGWVLRTLPDHAVDYARALIKTAEFLAVSRRSAPALASGAGEFRHFEERLTMILDRKPPELLRPLTRWTLGLAAAALLLVFPTWGDRTETEPPAPPPDGRIAELERESRALEARRLEIAAEVERLRATALRGRAEIDRAIVAERARAAAEDEVRRAQSDAVSDGVAEALERQLRAEARLLAAEADPRREERALRARERVQREIEREIERQREEQAIGRAGDDPARRRDAVRRRLELQAEELRLALEAVERARQALEPAEEPPN